jgi:hypothetical protein
MHEGREQGVVKPHLWLFPGYIEVALDIYREVGAQKNHLAGCLFRASQICFAADMLNHAHVAIRKSITLWEELCASQGGERYQNNLEGAMVQLRKIEE